MGLPARTRDLVGSAVELGAGDDDPRVPRDRGLEQRHLQREDHGRDAQAQAQDPQHGEDLCRRAL